MILVILMFNLGSFQIIILRTPFSPIEKQSHSLSTEEAGPPDQVAIFYKLLKYMAATIRLGH